MYLSSKIAISLDHPSSIGSIPLSFHGPTTSGHADPDRRKAVLEAADPQKRDTTNLNGQRTAGLGSRLSGEIAFVTAMTLSREVVNVTPAIRSPSPLRPMALFGSIDRP